jgi:hypothetical protein
VEVVVVGARVGAEVETFVVGTAVAGTVVVGAPVVGRVGAAVVQGSKLVPDGICGMHHEGIGVEGT